MSNLDGPFGFRSVRPSAGGTGGRSEDYSVASGYATGIFYGDPVKKVTGRNIEVAAAGDLILGIFQGCYMDDEAGRPMFSRYWPAGQVASNVKASVEPHAGNTYLVQATTIAEANIGSFCDMVAGAGSPTTGNSASEIDGATYAAPVGALTFQVKKLAEYPDNDYGDNALVEVVAVAGG